MKDEQTIYTEEKIIIIKPIKARIFSEDYEKMESYKESGEKVILFMEKTKI
jgi:hypothetical protein